MMVLFQVQKFSGELAMYKIFALVFVLLMTGCAMEDPLPPKPEPPKAPPEPVCIAPTKNNELIGQWYYIKQQKGVAGEVQTLMTFAADGKLKQQTRVKQGRNIRSELRETGCWSLETSVLTTQVVRSNGELVDFDDPIYTVRYQVDSVKGDRLMFRESRTGSKAVTAKKMPPSFLLN